jgi:diaminopimelate epimerase
MGNLRFTKMVASGNDFVVIESSHKSQVTSHKLLAKKMCDRKYGIGADGVLLLEKSKIADTNMRIFNADGSEAEMCGNGARCTALYISRQSTADSRLRKTKIETKAGFIGYEVSGDNVKVKLTDPKNIKLDIPIKVNNRNIKVNFIDTGVPHAVIFTEGLDQLDIVHLGRLIRYHEKFSPRGTNVNFAEVLSSKSIKVRTYERGVEDETLACGTGSAACALIFALKTNALGKINVHTRSKEVLSLYHARLAGKFSNVWLEGKARKVYEGEYYV